MWWLCATVRARTVSELAASTESCRVAVASVQDALGAVSSIRVGVQMPVALYPDAAGTEAETVTLAEQASRFAIGLGSLGVNALVVELTELSSASNATEENLGAVVRVHCPTCLTCSVLTRLRMILWWPTFCPSARARLEVRLRLTP